MGRCLDDTNPHGRRIVWAATQMCIFQLHLKLIVLFILVKNRAIRWIWFVPGNAEAVSWDA